MMKAFEYFKFDIDGALDVVRDVRKVFIPLKLHINVCKPWKFGNAFSKAWILYIENVGCFWKDKFESPRFEGTPYSVFGPSPRISITFFKLFKVVFWWEAPIDSFKDESTYWEMWLWYKYYSGSDIKKARETWPWQDQDDKSTWIEEFVLPKWQNS